MWFSIILVRPSPAALYSSPYVTTTLIDNEFKDERINTSLLILFEAHTCSGASDGGDMVGGCLLPR